MEILVLIIVTILVLIFVDKDRDEDVERQANHPGHQAKLRVVTFGDGRTENDHGDDYGLRRKRSFTVVVAVVVNRNRQTTVDEAGGLSVTK